MPVHATNTLHSPALLRDHRRLEILAQIARSITVNMTYGEIIETFALPLRDVIPYDLLSFCLLEGDALVIKSGIPKEQEILGVGTAMGPEYYIPWRALNDGRVCLRTDIWNDECDGAEDSQLRRLGIRSAVVAPLLVNNQAIGTLNLGHRHAYDETDAVYVQRLADQLAVCLQNSRLYQEVLDVKSEWERTFRAVQDLLVVVDRQGDVVRVNHETHGEAVGRNYHHLFRWRWKGPGPVEEVIETRQEVSAEVGAADPDRVLSVCAYPVFGKGGGVAKVVVAVRDVTAKRKLESQLFQSAKLAALGEMAAGVAHELNSPLTAVIGNSSLLLRRTSPENSAYKLLEDVKSCGQRCKKIIQHMLTFARQESWEFEPVRVNDVVRNSIEIISHQLEKDRIDLRTELSDTLPAVLGSAHQLEQVVINLLLNARDALQRKGERVIRVGTDYGFLENGELGVGVSVVDSGVGMGVEVADKVFNPFFTTKGGTKGTGLGLSVSLGIAKNHGGMITVTSAPNQGSTFTLLLPQMARQFMDGERTRAVASSARGPIIPAAELDRLRPSLHLARSLGRLQAQLGGEAVEAVEVEYLGKAAEGSTAPLTAAALEGLLSAAPGEAPVTLVNAVAVARQRGICVVETRSSEGEDYVSMVRLTVETSTGRSSVAGALFAKGQPRVVELGAARVEVIPRGHLLLCWAHDRPGLLGSIASVLARNGINIGEMRSGTEARAGRAVAVFNVDHPLSEVVLAELRQLPDLIRVTKVTL